MKANKKYRLIFSLIMLVLILFSVPAFGSNTDFKIDYLNDRLSVSVEQLPLGSVLEKVQKTVGIDFMVGKEDAGSIISVYFQSLPVEKALKRVLNQFNYALLFDAKGRASKVIVLGALEKSAVASSVAGAQPSRGPAMDVTRSAEETNVSRGGEEMNIDSNGEEMNIVQNQ